MAENSNHENPESKMINDDNFSFNVTYEDDTCIYFYTINY